MPGNNRLSGDVDVWGSAGGDVEVLGGNVECWDALGNAGGDWGWFASFLEGKGQNGSVCGGYFEVMQRCVR